jgi:hypothetical protein
MNIVGNTELFEWVEKTAKFKARGDDINRVWKIIEDTFKVGDNTTSKYVAYKIIQMLKLPVNPEEIWGGKNRAHYLFPLIFNPLKYLAKEGYIWFDKRGNLGRMK